MDQMEVPISERRLKRMDSVQGILNHFDLFGVADIAYSKIPTVQEASASRVSGLQFVGGG